MNPMNIQNNKNMIEQNLSDAIKCAYIKQIFLKKLSAFLILLHNLAITKIVNSSNNLTKSLNKPNKVTSFKNSTDVLQTEQDIQSCLKDK